MKHTKDRIELENMGFFGNNGPVFRNVSLTVRGGETLGILGSNGSGKSLLARIIAGDLLSGSETPAGEPGVWGTRRLYGDMENANAAYVSFGLQSSILAAEHARDDSDFLEGALDPGRSVETLIREGAGFGAGEDPVLLEELLAGFSLGAIRSRGLRFLSTGEFRKTLICRALYSKPRLLILDEPFTGLDADSRKALTMILEQIHHTDLGLVIFTSRGTDLPFFCTRAAVLYEDGLFFGETLQKTRDYYAALSGNESRELAGFLGQVAAEVDSGGAMEEPLSQPLVEIRHGHVSYYQVPVLRDINWTVQRGEHWQISGPNGAGKSTLLSLINGDSPKAYGQDISLFGRKRGTGETVWEIKQRIGFVSGGFHLGYLVKQKVLGVVLSGFYDSVGLYDRPSPVQKETAELWCRRLGLAPFADTFFEDLSFGVQRTVLLARAMIKDPEILILDEPCQGLDDAHTGVVLAAVEYIASRNHSTVLYVSHEPSLSIPSIKKRLSLIPHSDGGYTAEIS